MNYWLLPSFITFLKKNIWFNYHVKTLIVKSADNFYVNANFNKKVLWITNLIIIYKIEYITTFNSLTDHNRTNI